MSIDGEERPMDLGRIRHVALRRVRAWDDLRTGAGALLRRGGSGLDAGVTWGRPDRWHSPAPDRHGTLGGFVCSMSWSGSAIAESRRTFEAGSSAAASCQGPTRCTTMVLHGGPDSK